MPLPLPATAAAIFLITGLAGVIVFAGYRVAEEIAPELEPGDMLPALPPNPPIPRFIIEKPELIENFKR